MTLSMTILAAVSYLFAIVTVWFSLLRMRREKSVRRGLPLWSLSLAFAVVASYAFGQAFVFVPDFISHINAIVLLGYFAVEFLLYKKIQGGRTQIYWLILLSSFLVACVLVGEFFVPALYQAQFFLLIKIPVLFFLSYVLMYIWPTFILTHLQVISILWCSAWILVVIIFFFKVGNATIGALLPMLVSLLSFFFVVSYLIALDSRMYSPAMYYFNERKALFFTLGAVLMTASVGCALTVFDAWALLY